MTARDQVLELRVRVRLHSLAGQRPDRQRGDQREQRVPRHGVPGTIYSFDRRIQAWGGLLGIYTDNYTNLNGKEDTFELRPFAGAKLFLPNTLKWNSYTRERAWQPNTFYFIANTEPMYRFDKSDIDPARVQFGLAYAMNTRIRPEFLYYANWGRVGPDNTLAFNENVIRLNIKVGLNRALLGHVWNPGHE